MRDRRISNHASPTTPRLPATLQNVISELAERRLPGGAIVAILLAVATLQLLLAGFGRLNPWKGGGFGMFSTIDVPTQRALALTAVMPDGTELRLVPVGDWSRALSISPQAIRDVITQPTYGGLLSLARAALHCEVGDQPESRLARDRKRQAPPWVHGLLEQFAETRPSLRIGPGSGVTRQPPILIAVRAAVLAPTVVTNRQLMFTVTAQATAHR